ncbi:unnamed protein product [Cylindrotheca closterium]|uniref:Uncharacterized protein n=1 Tax=Cylindrotheca closterium TaxID=2856 RepID=A0AAD2JKV3_9STRA|nr:unnamed protein product [Cylindrotheca closterium]CAJ1959794.1 unnamed protein product [Cylindrotheca closterium]
MNNKFSRFLVNVLGRWDSFIPTWGCSFATASTLFVEPELALVLQLPTYDLVLLAGCRGSDIFNLTVVCCEMDPSVEWDLSFFVIIKTQLDLQVLNLLARCRVVVLEDSLKGLRLKA